MKTEKKIKKKYLGSNKPQLLEITEVLNAIIKEADNIPAEVKNFLKSARDSAWQGFISQMERINKLSE